MIEAVVFDLDGVILETEEVWDEVRGRYVVERGGRYDEAAQRAMMGMSSPEWSRYLAEELGVPRTPEEISADIVRLMEARYREELPLIAGAREAVERLAARWPLGLASSSNRPLIDARAGAVRPGQAVRGHGVVRGGAARQARPGRLSRGRATARASSRRCAAVEDSHSGIGSAKAAGMRGGRDPEPELPT